MLCVRMLASLLTGSLIFALGCKSSFFSKEASSSPEKSPAEMSVAGSQNVQLPVIDVHTHARFNGTLERSSKLPITREEYLKEMKEAGVVATISHMGRGGEGYNADMKNVFHCFGVDEKVDLVDIEKGLKAKKYRCIKIYLGYIHRYANDPAYRAVYRLAQKYNVAVVFHTGDTYSVDGKLKYSDPLTIDEVAVDFRKVNFVIAHMGNPWVQSAAEVAYKNPNVYLEASAMLIGDLKLISPAGLEKYMIEPIRWAFGYMENPSKLMYGTDWPLTGMKDYLEAYKKAIPREHWCDVFFNNAVRVFQMQEITSQYACKVD